MCEYAYLIGIIVGLRVMAFGLVCNCWPLDRYICGPMGQIITVNEPHARVHYLRRLMSTTIVCRSVLAWCMFDELYVRLALMSMSIRMMYM